VVVNGCLPDAPGLERDPAEAAAEAGLEVDTATAAALRRAAEFHRHRSSLQEEQLVRLGEELPLPQLRTRVLYDDHIGPDQLELLASDLAAGIERLPDERPAAGQHRRPSVPGP
jgi:hypothetical protein